MKDILMKLWLVVLISVVVVSCNKDEAQRDLNINFKLEYDGSPLVMLDDYFYPDGRKMIFNRFSFYLAEMKFDGIKMMDVDYLNLTGAHATLEGAQQGYKYTIKDVKVGDYSKIEFDFGLPSVLNDKKPADYDSEDLLSLVSEYWTGWESYIFARLEGQIDLDNDGSIETGFSLHTGGNEAMRIISINKSFTVSDEGSNEIDIILDIKKVFENQAVYDMDSNPQIHTPNQQDQVVELSDNYKVAFLTD